MVVAIVLPRADGTGETNVTVRGLTPIGFKLRDNLSLAEGRWFSTGQREVMVSKSVKKRFGAEIGKTLAFGKGLWTVVGVFDASGTAYDSEIWGDVNQMANDFDRTGGYSVAHIRATDDVAADSLTKVLADDQRLKLEGVAEMEYFAKQTRSGAPIQFVGTLVAIIMAVGSCFAAMNTMYAIVAARTREIGTLRALGFSRFAILFSFVLESVFLAVVGGALGCLLAFPMNNFSTGTGSGFSELAFAFKITPPTLIIGIVFAALMGVFGGLLPAFRAARMPITSALREA
jgi:putative ABC transport system permease protein